MKNLPMTALLGVAMLAATIPAVAQSGSNDTGAGVQRGTQEMKNSGQVGTVTLFQRGSATGVLLEIKSTPRQNEVASINRGKGCDPKQIDPVAAYRLEDLVGGRSRTVVNASSAKLLSNNYVVVVRSGKSGTYASCGHLYI
jgi:hypothetical protein